MKTPNAARVGTPPAALRAGYPAPHALAGGPALALRGHELPLAPPEPPGVLPDLWTSVRNARHNPESGQPLEDRLAEFSSSDVQSYGVALLTAEELFGSEQGDYEDGVCDWLEAEWTFTEDGVDYEAMSYLFPITHYGNRPDEYEIGISDGCTAALDGETTVAAAVEAGDCFTEDETTFLRDGGECRTCVDGGDTWDDCVAARACDDEGQMVFWWNTDEDGNGFYVKVYWAYMALCAPDWYLFSFLLAREDTDDLLLPEAFDHEVWTGWCAPFWNEEIDDVYFYCGGDTADPPPGNTWAEGVPTRIGYIREVGQTGTPWWDRLAYLEELRFEEGWVVDSFWAGWPVGVGSVSAPWAHQDSNGDGEVGPGDEDWGSSYGGWGFDPRTLRPDATDPSDPHQSLARDYVAALVLKGSTRRNGVAVTFFNHNRCAAWVGPDDLGRQLCTETVEPEYGWLNDGFNHWLSAESGMTLTFPMMTLASTGLPDPDVPGGAVIYVAASEAWEDFESCTMPHTFAPDLVRYSDLPDVYDTTASVVGHTYRFDKDPDADIRVVMGANWHRNYCPEDGG